MNSTRFRPPAIALLALLCLGTGCRRGAQDTVLPSGTVEVDEVQVGSRYGGRVDQVLVQEGDTVAPGQELLRLSADELAARRDQVAALLAEQEAGPRAEEIASARAEWEVHAAELELARKDQVRALELFADRTIAASERDRAVSHAETAAKAAAAAKSRYELMVAGTRAERIAQTSAELAGLAAQLRELSLTAPTNAVVEVVSVRPGDVLAPNRGAMTLLLARHPWVRVYVPPSWLGHLRVGGEVRIRADAIPGREFKGVIEQIARTAEFTPRNVQTPADRAQQVFGIKIRLDSSGDELRAGMSVEADFGLLGGKPDA